MGCWNETCVISGLAIRAGEDAVAIPVVFKEELGYAGTLFPIFGEYNDYGSLENTTENVSAAMLLKTINEKLIAGVPKRVDPLTEEERAFFNRCKTNDRVSDEDNKRGWKLQIKIYDAKNASVQEPIRLSNRDDAELDADGKFASVDDLMAAIERGCIEVEEDDFSTDGYVWRPLTKVMIHRKVWDAMMEIVKQREFTVFWRTVPEELAVKYGVPEKKGYRSYPGEEFLKIGMESIELAVSSTKLTKHDINMVDERDYEAEIGSEQKKIAHMEQIIKSHEIGGFFRNHEYINYDTIFLREIAEHIIKDGLDAWRETLWNVFAMKISFDMMRKNFSVMSGAGSQADAYSMVQAVAEAALAVCKERASTDEEEG